MKILAFAASLRRGSLNRLLLAQAVGQLKEISRRANGLVIDHRDFHDFDMPLYDGDLEDRSGIPEGGLKFIDAILEADALVISTPEYNGGIPGTLKNAIDWASRREPIPFDGKPILLLAASTGSLGGVRSLWHTRVPFEAIGGFVYPEMFGLQKAHEAFETDGTFKDPRNAKRVGSLLGDFLEFAGRLTEKKSKA